MWLSLVERAVRVGEVQGSNPCSPIFLAFNLVRVNSPLFAAGFFIVHASTTKNHKQAILALQGDLVSELKKLPAHLMPKMSVFKNDFKVAGIEFLNAEGKRADFHSL